MESLGPILSNQPKLLLKNNREESNKLLPSSEIIEVKDKIELGKKQLSPLSTAYFPKLKKSNNPNGVFFIGGFEYFGLVPKKNDGIYQMSKAFPGSSFFSWDQKDQIISAINKVPLNKPLILVGHSFGGDTAVDLATSLDSIEHKFRPVDLLITLDSIGANNDMIPKNVKQNLNFVGSSTFFINGKPNIALSNDDTKIINEKVDINHSELDDHADIQRKIFKSITEQVQASE